MYLSVSDGKRSEVVQMLTVDGILDGTSSSPKEPIVYVNQAAAFRSEAARLQIWMARPVT